MADQGQWFKLWCAALDDPDLDALSLEQFARWAKLGALVKRQGTDGTLSIREPARVFCAMFQVPDFPALQAAFHGLPGVAVRSEKGSVSNGNSVPVSFSVSFDNWAKYQADLSTPRVRRWRERQAEMKRIRGEEMRGEEMRGEGGAPPPPISGGSDAGEVRRQPWPKHRATQGLRRKVRVGSRSVSIPPLARPVVDAWTTGYRSRFGIDPEPPAPWDLEAAVDLAQRHDPGQVLAIVEGALRAGGTKYMRDRDKWGLRTIADEWNTLVAMHVKGDLR